MSESVWIALIGGFVAIMICVLTQSAVIFLAFKKSRDDQKERDLVTADSRQHVLAQINGVDRKVSAVHQRQDTLERTGAHNTEVLAQMIRRATDIGALHPQASDYGKPTDVGKFT